MKKIIIISFFVLFICIWVWYFQTEIVNKTISRVSPVVEDTSEETLETNLIPTEEISEKQINQEKVREKIEKIKKRLALKWLISQGDEYFRNDQLTSALKSYVQAYRKNSEDEKIIKKLGDTYFEMHKFSVAERYYRDIKNSQWFEANKLALSIMYSTDVSSTWSIQETLTKLQDIWLSEDEYFYYENSISCLENFHDCKIRFDEYKKESIIPTAETQETPSTLWSPHLWEIQSAIENYRNFQVDQVYFKNALIVWALYSNQNYPIAIALWKELLEEKSDYKPIIKIIADSYYELGDYESAKLYLSSYYKQDNSDPGIAYLLWVIHSEEGDHVLSNIYLNKALKNGYDESINIRRQLIHNYFLLESWENIINAFYDLIESEVDYDKSDLELAIYYYILYEEYDQAKIWINKGMEKYPTEENFHGYLGWIRYEQWETQKAKEEIQKWLDINENNPFLNYNMGRIQKESWNIWIALVYFKKIIKQYPDSDFALWAKEEIEKISKK